MSPNARFEEKGSLIRLYHVGSRARTYEWGCIECEAWSRKLKNLRHKKDCKDKK